MRLVSVSSAGVALAHSDKDNSELDYNMDGDAYGKGANMRASINATIGAGAFMYRAEPEIRLSEGDEASVMKRSYAKMKIKNFEVEAGKNSMWWGPGAHGTLLLSNNARPLTSVRIGNPHPARLPSVFRYLGPAGFSAFFSRLGKDRTDVQRPYLWGLRVNIKPHPSFELGLSRTAMFGGSGRDSSVKAWWDSFTGHNENDAGREAGDQRAGADAKITLPFKAQPLQVYGEYAGEDEAGGLPAKPAYLAGVYLPRIASLTSLDLRAEYAENHVSGSPDVWYNHHIYASGYTHKGRVIGHHMGTDSRDIFASISLYAFSGRLYASFDREEHDLSASRRPVKNEAVFGFETYRNFRANGMRLGAEYASGKLYSQSGKEALNRINLMLGYFF